MAWGRKPGERERGREREEGEGSSHFSPVSTLLLPFPLSPPPSLATATDFMNFHFDVFVLESGGQSRSTKSTGGMRNRDEWNGSNEWACCTVTRSAGNVYSLSLSRFPFYFFPPSLPSFIFFLPSPFFFFLFFAVVYSLDSVSFPSFLFFSRFFFFSNSLRR